MASLATARQYAVTAIPNGLRGSVVMSEYAVLVEQAKKYKKRCDKKPSSDSQIQKRIDNIKKEVGKLFDRLRVTDEEALILCSTIKEVIENDG